MNNAFYHFSTGNTDDTWGKRDAGKDRQYYSRTPSSREHSARTGRDYIHEIDPYGLVDGFESNPVVKVPSCAAYPTHTRHVRSKYSWVASGDDLSPFIPSLGLIAGEAVLVRGDVAKQLRATSFSGFKLIATQPFDYEGQPRKLSQPVFIIEFMGKRCDKIVISPDVPNKCPFCGDGPIVCPECRNVYYPECPKCRKEYAAEQKRPGGKWEYVDRLKGLFTEDHRTLIGRDWDGSDFHGGGADNPRYISKRVLDWLLGLHAAPFAVTSVTVDTTGMTDEQLAKLETMKTLPGA
jgi:hypothetical protein